MHTTGAMEHYSCAPLRRANPPKGKLGQTITRAGLPKDEPGRMRTVLALPRVHLVAH